MAVRVPRDAEELEERDAIRQAQGFRLVWQGHAGADVLREVELVT